MIVSGNKAQASEFLKCSLCDLWASQVVLVVKNLSPNARDIREWSSIPGSRRASRRGYGNPSSSLAWRIPWTEEPGRLWATGSQRVRCDWSDLACTHTRLWSLMAPTALEHGFPWCTRVVTAEVRWHMGTATPPSLSSDASRVTTFLSPLSVSNKIKCHWEKMWRTLEGCNQGESWLKQCPPVLG